MSNKMRYKWLYVVEYNSKVIYKGSRRDIRQTIKLSKYQTERAMLKGEVTVNMYGLDGPTTVKAYELDERIEINEEFYTDNTDFYYAGQKTTKQLKDLNTLTKNLTDDKYNNILDIQKYENAKITNTVKSVNLVKGNKYNVRFGTKQIKLHIDNVFNNLEFMYKTNDNLFFKSPHGWVESFPLHKYLVKIEPAQ